MTKLRKEKSSEEFEDIILGHLAKERAKNSKPDDFIPIKVVAKKLGVKLK